MTHAISSVASTIVVSPGYYKLENPTINDRAAEREHRKAEAEVQRAHELQMQAAKGKDDRRLTGEEEMYKKEKHKDAAEIYETLVSKSNHGINWFIISYFVQEPIDL